MHALGNCAGHGVTIHLYTYIYIHIHLYTYIYCFSYLDVLKPHFSIIHAYTYIYIHIHTYTYIYIHILTSSWAGRPWNPIFLQIKLEGGVGGPGRRWAMRCHPLPVTSEPAWLGSHGYMDQPASVYRMQLSLAISRTNLIESKLTRYHQGGSAWGRGDSSSRSPPASHGQVHSAVGRARSRIRVDSWAALAVSLPVPQNAAGSAKGPTTQEDLNWHGIRRT